MKTKRFTYNKRYLYILLSMLLPFLSSCIDDKHTIVSGDKELVKLSIDSPYSRGDVGENPQSSLENVVVLVFKVEGGKELFAYRALASEPKHKEGTTYEIGAYLTHSKEQEKYRLVLLGNPDKKYGNLHHLKGKDKETVLKELLFDAKGSETSYDWAGKDALPLHGESDPRIIHEHTSFNEIEMTRALAKVDITLNEEKNVSKEYTLEEAWVFNSLNTGLIGDYRDNESEGPVLPPELTPASYNRKGIKFTSPNTPILLAENEAGIMGDTEETTCFVIGVKKNSKLPLRYYRVELVKDEKLLPIIRNCYYTIIIDEISGEGYSTEEEAFAGEIECVISLEVCEWNETEHNYYVDGESFFSLASRFISLSEPNEGQYVEFKTNMPLDKCEIANTNTEFSVEQLENRFVFTLKNEVTQIKRTNITIEIDKSMKIDFPVYLFPKETDNPTPDENSIDITCYPNGLYIRGESLSANKHYLSCNLESKGIDFDLYSHVVVRTPVRDKLEGVHQNRPSGYNYGFKTIYKLTNEDKHHFNVPGLGQALNTGQQIVTDNLPVYFEFIPKKSTTDPLIFKKEINIDILYNRPIVHGLKILFIADGYNIYQKGDSWFKNNNLGRLLRSDQMFGLLSDSHIKVAPFEFITSGVFRYVDYIKQQKLLAGNVICSLSSFSELENVHIDGLNKINDYDVIFFIRAKEEHENELLSTKYSDAIIEFIKNKNKVFIQTPSLLYSEAFFDDASNYNDRIVESVFDFKGFDLKSGSIGRSSAGFGNARPMPLILSKYESNIGRYDRLLNEPFALENKYIYFPRSIDVSTGSILGKKSRFSDFQYIDIPATRFQYSLSEALVIKEIMPQGLSPEKIISWLERVFSNDITSPLFAKKDNYCWIGSSYFFIDDFFKVNGSGYPETAGQSPVKFGWFDSSSWLGNASLNNPATKIIVGDFFERKDTENSRFFVNMMNWAINKTDKVIK